MRAFYIGDFLFGRVAFVAAGGFRNRFLQETHDLGVPLFHMKVREQGIAASVREADYGKVLEAAKRSGMELLNVRRGGVRAFLRRYRYRAGIPLGLLLGALLFQMLSCVLWTIDIKGADMLNEEAFTAYLAENGVKRGAYLTQIDCNEIERLIEAYSEKILVSVVNLTGCRLYIHVQPSILPPEMQPVDACGNLIAAREGEIVSAAYYAGEPAARPGDTVNKGDILVYGFERLNSGGVRFVDAKADIIARTTRAVSCVNAPVINARRIGRLKNAYSLYFFGLVFPPRKESNYTLNCVKTRTGVLPVGYARATAQTAEETQLRLNENAAAALALNDLAVRAVNVLSGVPVERAQVSLSHTGGVAANAVFTCLESIAEKQYFESEEGAPPENGR